MFCTSRQCLLRIVRKKKNCLYAVLDDNQVGAVSETRFTARRALLRHLQCLCFLYMNIISIGYNWLDIIGKLVVPVLILYLHVFPTCFELPGLFFFCPPGVTLLLPGSKTVLSPSPWPAVKVLLPSLSSSNTFSELRSTCTAVHYCSCSHFPTARQNNFVFFLIGHHLDLSPSLWFDHTLDHLADQMANMVHHLQKVGIGEMLLMVIQDWDMMLINVIWSFL